MDARWRRIQELFHAAAERPEAERRAFLEQACGDDPAAVAEVLAMLASDARGAPLLDRGVAHVASRIVDREMNAAPPPETIRPYQITNLLGEGGMGVVYRAERTDVGSVVALKILRDAWLSPARRERFTREQRLLAQLNHPAIVALHDAGALPDGTPWFVMEYVDGRHITEHCRERRSPFNERLLLFREVCAAVQHAHRNLVIHRDLKPSNILVTTDGHVKLLDFGISKRLEGAGQPVSDETRTGLRLMTPAYASPEQLRGAPPAVDTDVYALGVVLYELLAGRLPFDLGDRTPSEAAVILSQATPPKPSVVAADASLARKDQWADLNVLVLTAMHHDRARRYPTVEALVRDVDHYLRGEPLDAQPDDLRYRAGKFARRHTRALAAAGLGLAAVTTLFVLYTVRVTAARNTAQVEARRAARIQRFMLDLFEGGDRSAGPTEGLLAVTLLDRGVKEVETLEGEPSVQADLYQTLGGIYRRLGRLDKADQLMSTALSRRRALSGDGDPAVARGEVELGLLRVDQAKLDEAERLVREGLAKAKRVLPQGHRDIAKATLALGEVLENRGAYGKAIPVLEEAVALAETMPESADLAAAITELANTHFYAGHYDVCRQLNERVLALDIKLHGPRHPTVSGDIINLGAIQAELGRYAEAEVKYREGLAITEAWYGADHPQTAADLTMLGRVLQQQGKLDEALAPLRRALAIRERVFGKVHPAVASTLSDLGAIARQEKHLDEAAADFERMAAIYRAIYGGDNHYLVGIALSNLGSVYFDEGKLAEAEQLFRQTVAIMTKQLSGEHLNTGIARLKLGRALLRQGHFVEAETETRSGYEVVRKQMNPSVSWLAKARQDLVEESQALGKTADAARFRAELAQTK